MKFNGTNRGRFLSASGMSSQSSSSWSEFVAAHRTLLLFSIIFLTGAFLGVIVFAASKSFISDDLCTMLQAREIAGGFQGGISALFSSCFSTVLLLALLFLLGLSACGAPFAMIVPLFFGMGLGLSEAYYYSNGITGLLAAGLLVVPHYMVAAAALILGCMESVRMSLLFSRQLLPGGVMGGLWNDFKLFTTRFLLFFGLAFASGVIDVCMRLIFSSLFT